MQPLTVRLTFVTHASFSAQGSNRYRMHERVGPRDMKNLIFRKLDVDVTWRGCECARSEIRPGGDVDGGVNLVKTWMCTTGNVIAYDWGCIGPGMRICATKCGDAYDTIGACPKDIFEDV